MTDTQKTTKAVREAPTVPQKHVSPAEVVARVDEMLFEPLPRYTVELTTEGWQIKDNVKGIVTASTFGSQEKAGQEAQAWNELRAIETKDRH